ncbi:MAG: exosortase system-associated protein, TIGR04073 family [Candidatus Sumerlaeia bacterium]|nr:exosortase system-associated protein, TIGR04073 family [Candidatus Sumerlaeia bacterium]
MFRTLTLALTASALVTLTAGFATAQLRTDATPAIYAPSQAPTYRGSQAPIVNPYTFQDSEEVGRSNTTFGRQLHKLGRGLLNTLTGFLEVPKRIAQVWRDTDPVTGAVVGTIEGLGWGVARTATGIYDVVTFPIPVPANYEPMMQPEYVLPELWGATVPGLAGDR